MKKAIIILAVLGVLIFAGVLVFKRSGGPSKASLLAPADTILFVNIPNVPMSGFRWQKTALARIAGEPEVVEFLKMPTSRVTNSAGGDETIELLTALKPGNIFLSVGEGSQVLLGFQFWGKRADFDNAVERLRANLPGDGGEVQTLSHRGIELTGTRHGDRVLWSAAAGRWGLLATDSDVVCGAIDRATGAEDALPGLGSVGQFLMVSAALPSDPDLLVFLRPDKAVDSLVEAGRSLGGEVIPAQAAALKSAEAMGAAWKMDGERQRDALFFLRPRDVASLPKLSHEAMALTDAETDFFFDFVLNFDALPEFWEGVAGTLPDMAPRLGPYMQMLSRSFGPECAVVGDWAPGKMAPSAFVALQVRDKEGAAAFPAFLAGNIPGAVSEDIGGAKVTTLPSGQGAFTILQNDKFLLAGPNRDRLLGASNGASGNTLLSGTPGFESAMKAYRGANEMFGFIDTRVVFENVYNTLMPVLRLSAMMVPSIAEVVEVEKMPAAATIGKHLSPIVVSQKVTAEGTLLESSGPVSLGQFILIGSAAAGTLNQSLFGR